MSSSTPPFGSWPSPLKARGVATSSLGLAYATAARGALHWIESRPLDGGRCVLVRAAAGAATDITAAPMNVRSKVHEYGGRPYAVVGDTIVACDFASQRLHVWREGATPRAVTAEGHRYADFAVDAAGVLYAVREDHSRAAEPANAVVAIDLSAEVRETVLYAGSDFVAYPRPAATGGWRSSRGTIRTCRGTRPRCMSRTSAPTACGIRGSSQAGPPATSPS